MNLILAVAVGLLFATALFQLTSRDLFQVSLGVYLLLNASNLFLATVEGAAGVAAPFGTGDIRTADPLVQAMILTAIVISFGIATFLLLLSAALGRRRKSMDVEQLRKWRQ